MAIAFVFVVLFVWRHIPTLQQTASQWDLSDTLVLVASGVLAAAGMSLHAWSFAALYPGAANEAGAVKGLWLTYLIANVFKYIPGRVATVAALLSSASYRGFDQARTLQAFLGALSLSGTMAAASLAFSLGAVGGELTKVVGVTVILSGLALLHPRINHAVVALAARLVGRSGPALGPYRYTDLLRAAGIQALAWLLLGSSFGLLVMSIARVPLEGAAWCATAYPAAFMAGVASVLTPAGLGVREGLLTGVVMAYASADTALPQALFATVAHRLLLTAVDGLLFLIATCSDWGSALDGGEAPRTPHVAE